MATKVTTAEFRAELSKYLNMAMNGGTIVVTRNGFPVVQLVPFANPVLALPAAITPEAGYEAEQAEYEAGERALAPIVLDAKEVEKIAPERAAAPPQPQSLDATADPNRPGKVTIPTYQERQRIQTSRDELLNAMKPKKGKR